jgi:hypothetical protein
MTTVCHKLLPEISAYIVCFDKMSDRSFTVSPNGISNTQGIRKFIKSSVQSTNFNLLATEIYGVMAGKYSVELCKVVLENDGEDKLD